MMERKPKVSVVMPCWNEEGFIEDAIESLMDEYFRENGELIVVDGMSNDRTKEIVQSYIKKGYPIRLLENEHRTQANGMNQGISYAKGDIIVRADAHCVYPHDYIKKCVKLLVETGAANVGGMMYPKGNGDGQNAIALALRHPVGVGDARWHLGNYKGYVDTVYLGAFKKDLFNEIGLYDTSCETNEDAELNLRILKNGRRIYLDSAIKVVYFPRETLKKLARQYYKYGKGRAYTTKKHKKLTSWRQTAPVTLVLGLAASLGLSIWKPVFLLVPSVYLLSLFIVAMVSWRRGFRWWDRNNPNEGTVPRVPMKQRMMTAGAWAIMHVCWGVGFIIYLFRK